MHWSSVQSMWSSQFAAVVHPDAPASLPGSASPRTSTSRLASVPVPSAAGVVATHMPPLHVVLPAQVPHEPIPHAFGPHTRTPQLHPVMPSGGAQPGETSANIKVRAAGKQGLTPDRRSPLRAQPVAGEMMSPNQNAAFFISAPSARPQPPQRHVN